MCLIITAPVTMVCVCCQVLLGLPGPLAFLHTGAVLLYSKHLASQNAPETWFQQPYDLDVCLLNVVALKGVGVLSYL